jgi:hypothetical protein
MGAEINAARAMIYSRLSGDSALASYVGSRIYAGAAPQGTQTSGMYCIYSAVIDTQSQKIQSQHVQRAHGSILWDPVKFHVVVWNEATDFSNLGAAADRVGVLLDGWSGSSGGYDVYALKVVSVEERVVDRGGSVFLGVGYDFLCFVSPASSGYVEASRSYLAFGPNGGEYTFSGSMYGVELHMVYKKHEETRVDEVVARPLPQALEYSLVLTAPYTAAVDAALFGQIKLTGRSLIWGPEGSAAGKRKYTSLGAYLADYRHLCPDQGAVQVRALIEINGDLTQGVF